MKTNKEYIQEDIFASINKLLKKTDLSSLIGDDSYSENESQDLSKEIEVSESGKLNLHMDAMKMNLYMDLTAPVNQENDISILSIKNRVLEFGEECYNKVDWTLVQELYNRVFIEGEIIPSTPIAKGTVVEYRIPEYIRVKDSLYIDLAPKMARSGNVDFHKINSFITVTNGEYIGDIIPEFPGISGRNLLGETIPPPTKVISYITKGINTVERSGKLYSSIDGCLKILNDTIFIDNCLEITTNVDYQTGDIDFDGDVHVVMSVREGFKIKSNGDIFIDENLEPTNVTCTNNLYVQQGIWGDPKYNIMCGGILTSKHIEHSNIKSKGTVYAQKSIIKSNISTLDKIVLDKTGAIIGGEYHALNGIKVGNVGNKSGITTNIVLGTDYEVKEKLKIIQGNITEINFEMDRLQNNLKATTEREERDKIKYLFLCLKNRLNSLNNYSRSLLSRLDKNDKSTLIVTGTIYPGTNIDICHLSLKIDKEYKKVEFSLDKENGKIKWEYI